MIHDATQPPFSGALGFDWHRNLLSALLARETVVDVCLSPHGGSVGFVKRVSNADQIWVFHHGEGRCLNDFNGRTVKDLRWSPNSRMLLFRLADRGREIWSLAMIDSVSGKQTTLTGTGTVSEYWTSPDAPEQLLFSWRGPETVGMSELRMTKLRPFAQPCRIRQDSHSYHRRLVDRQFRIRGGIRISTDGSANLDVHAVDGLSTHSVHIPVQNLADLHILHFEHTGRLLYLLSSHEANTRRLIALDTETGAITTIFEDPDFDVASYPIAGEGTWTDPQTGHPDICSVFDARLRWYPLTLKSEQLLDNFERNFGAGSPVIVDRSADDRIWLVAVVHDNAPLDYVRYDTGDGTVEYVLVNRPDLVGARLPQLTDVMATAQDGMPLCGYWLSPLSEPAPFPTVVMVHGGPASRDIWRFNAEAQYLAALGYASLHVNYRGSRGFGVDFRRAGEGQWGAAMQTDLYDCLQNVSAELVDLKRVAYFGSSYGGYAALLAATTRAKDVRCAVAISPQCDLKRLINDPPRFFGPLRRSLGQQIWGTDEMSGELLAHRSPFHALSKNSAPMLIAHGCRDPRIPVDEVDAFVDAARGLGIDVRYLRFEDEGHVIQGNTNRQVLFDAVETFLGDYCGHS